jgi:outer membrane protein assembly factor BamB
VNPLESASTVPIREIVLVSTSDRPEPAEPPQSAEPAAGAVVPFRAHAASTTSAAQDASVVMRLPSVHVLRMIRMIARLQGYVVSPKRPTSEHPPATVRARFGQAGAPAGRRPQHMARKLPRCLVRFACALLVAGSSLSGGAAARPAWASRPIGAQTTSGGRTAVDWPRFHYSLDRDGYNPLETTLTTSNVAGLKLHWRTYIASVGGYSGSSPAIVGGVAYVGSDDGNVYAVNATTGAVLWTFRTGGAVDSSPAVAGGVVYIGSNDATVYALNASTGAKVWSFTTGSKVTASPLVANGIVYVGSRDGVLYALRASGGTVAWKTSKIWTMWNGPALANGVLYVETDQSKLFAFDAATGTQTWSATLGGRGRSSPAVVGGVVYTGCDDGRVYAFNATTGALKWKTGVLPGVAPVLVRSSPAVWNGMVYVSTLEGVPGNANGHAYAFNASTGAQAWVQGFSDMSGVSPAVANGMVFTAEYGHQAYAMDAMRGTKLWKSGFTTFLGITDGPAVVNGNLYFLNIDGYLYDYGL